MKFLQNNLEEVSECSSTDWENDDCRHLYNPIFHRGGT